LADKDLKEPKRGKEACKNIPSHGRIGRIEIDIRVRRSLPYQECLREEDQECKKSGDPIVRLSDSKRERVRAGTKGVEKYEPIEEKKKPTCQRAAC